jgi:ketosteroid isomerase-like protein
MIVTPIDVVSVFRQAWSEHDLEKTLAMGTSDCIFDSSAPAPDGTLCRGIEEIRVNWRPIFEDLSSNFEAEETFAVGDRVAQRWIYSWAGGHIRGVDVFRIRDGKVAEKFSYVKG